MVMARSLALLALCGVAAAKDSMAFLAIGDWGGTNDFFPTAKGEVDNNMGMGAVAGELGGVDFVMALGDNFYSSGVGSCTSKRFEKTFEDVFDHENLQVPWYVVAGNHDHYGNVSAQIEYTSLSPTKRWKFPSLYYTFNASFTPKGASKPVTTQVVYVDTYTMSGMSFKNDATGEIVKGAGPPDALKASDQLAWLEAQLKASTADYLWVAGHYPVYSQCEHGPTAELQRDVLPLLEKYNANGFLAGHDHCLGHFVDTSSRAFVLSGAGKECCYSPAHKGSNPSGYQKFGLDASTKKAFGNPDGGFVSFNVTAEATQIVYHYSSGKVMYTADPVKPRTRQ